MSSQQSARSLRRVLGMLAALGIPALCAATPAQMQPGEWRITMHMDMPGLPAQARQPQTITHCVTPEQARDPQAAMSKMNKPGKNGETCKVAHSDISGNTVHWIVECTGPHPVRGDGTVTFDSDVAYHGTMQTTMNGPQGSMTLNQTLTAQRIGACKP